MRYARTTEETRAQIAQSFAERDRTRNRLTKLITTPAGREVEIRQVGPVSPEDQEKIDRIRKRELEHMLANLTFVTLDQADELRLMVYGEYAPNNPNGLRT